MKNYKKILIALISSLFVVLSIQFFWNKTIKKDEEIYIAIKDIYKGERITEDAIIKIKVKKSSILKKYYNIDVKNKIATVNIQENRVISQEDMTEFKENISIDEEYEYIAIEVKNISDSLAYQLKKGDYINVYYTVKDKKLTSNMNGKNLIEGLDDTNTIRLFEKIKVIGLYNSSGDEVTNTGQYIAIMLRVKKDDAILVSNIKAHGTFNISYVE